MYKALRRGRLATADDEIKHNTCEHKSSEMRAGFEDTTYTSIPKTSEQYIPPTHGQHVKPHKFLSNVLPQDDCGHAVVSSNHTQQPEQMELMQQQMQQQQVQQHQMQQHQMQQQMQQQQVQQQMQQQQVQQQMQQQQVQQQMQQGMSGMQYMASDAVPWRMLLGLVLLYVMIVLLIRKN